MLPFKRKKDILIVILTSCEPERLMRCYRTLLNNKSTLSADINIMINSLDPSHPKKVYDKFKNESVAIYESESNGTAPKAGNCMLDHFRNHKKNYRYLMCVDGDDFFYPTAFDCCFDKVLEYRPDIAGLQASDTLLRMPSHRNNEYYHHIEEDIYLNSWNNQEPNLNVKFPKSFDKPLFSQYPIDRTLFMSERFLKNERDLAYPEELAIYSDYTFNYFVFEKAFNNGYSYIHFSNSYGYIWDKLNPLSITKNYKNDGSLIENNNPLPKKGQSVEEVVELFPKIVNPVIERCGGDIDFRIIPFLKIGPPKYNFNTEKKVEFIRSNLLK